jgi:predicted molibdopterin-dependent oxidoreductase YjgC
VLYHPLPHFSNSVGANDMMPDKKLISEVTENSRALYIGGSLQSNQLNAEFFSGKDFVVVQELFETATTDFADVVLPAASFAEMDGTYTNNDGFVQRVRQSIEPVNQAKPDWVITSLIAREMDVDFGYNFSASAVFKALADSVAPYHGLRYPHLKDESRPVQVKHAVTEKREMTYQMQILSERVEALPRTPDKNTETPRVGHKLHQVHTLTGKTGQFHLLANGNPKPENLLVSPLVQFNLDGTPRVTEEMAMAVGVGDRIDDKENVSHKVIVK